MKQVRLSKADVIWSYLAQFFNFGAGLITLPLILNRLNEDEIGMNYLMITISSLIALLDFGFTPQFSRNITYVFAGVPSIKKVGIEKSVGKINFTLLSNMIQVAKKVYAILAISSLVLMITGGSLYIYHVTDGFSTVKNSLIIWLIYSISVFFNIYYIYYTSLLTGRGQIMESKKAMIAQRIAYILITYLLILVGLGLLGVVIANLLSPFVGRYISYRMFYDSEIKTQLNLAVLDKKYQKKLFLTIWYNSKRLGLAFIGAYAINKIAMFLAGLFLNLSDIASYGLLIQLTTIVSGIATTYNSASLPTYNYLRTEENNSQLINRFSESVIIYYIIYLLGGICIVTIAPVLLRIIGSNALLPSKLITIIYLIVVFFEGNHSLFANFITTGNSIPFVESTLITGIAISTGSFLILKYTGYGLLGIIIVQGICETIYSNWKWPYVVCKDFHISFLRFLKYGISKIHDILVTSLHKIIVLK